MKRVLILNGPKMNMLGKREPSVYGHLSLEEMNRKILEKAESIGIQADFFQSSHEGALIDRLHQSYGNYDAVILNAAAYTHYSIAIRDAVKASGVPVIEVHMSNVHAREEFRHKSVLSPVCIGQICGFGINSYIAALYVIRDMESL